MNNILLRGWCVPTLPHAIIHTIMFTLILFSSSIQAIDRPANSSIKKSQKTETIKFTSKFYAIQLKLSSEEFRWAEIQKLEVFNHYRLYTKTITLKEKQWHQLRMGFFPTLAAARKINSEIQKKYSSSWIVTVRENERLHADKSLLNSSLDSNANAPAPTEIDSKSAVSNIVIKKKEKLLKKLMDEARQAVIQQDYSRAVALYTKILQSPQSRYHQDALEFLGLTRERKGQMAHAKAIYEKYLKLYPEDEGYGRVRQRLEGIITARQIPKKKTNEREAVKTPSSWMMYGGFSQYYRRAASFLDQAGDSLDHSALATDLDTTGRYRDGRYDVRTRFSGGYDLDFLDNGDDTSRITALYIDGADRRNDISARLGRQSLSKGGVLGRFDGLRFSYQPFKRNTINLVTGYPVESFTNSSLDTDRYFYGINLDIGSFSKAWNFNTFYIKQLVDDMTDREAIGGESRYFSKNSSILMTVDYDIWYEKLNIIQFLGNLTLPSRTILNLLMEYRSSPIISTSNALLGQTSDTINDMLKIFSRNEIKGLAEDRTADYKTFSLGASHPLNRILQLRGEFTITNLSDMPESGSVLSIEGSGNEYFYDLQLTGSNMFKKGDLGIVGLRFSDTSNAKTTTMILDTRIPAFSSLRLNPRMVVNYRNLNNSSGDQWGVSPSIRVDYQLRRNIYLEIDTSFQWTSRDTINGAEKSKSYFLNAGYRYIF